MSKEEYNPLDKLPKRNQRGGGFNFYWIYAIVVIAILATQLYNFKGSNTGKIDRTTLNDYLKSGLVKKIVIVNKSIAEIYIHPDSLSNKKFIQNGKYRRNGE